MKNLSKKVYLVGAGPGDPGLLTLKGKKLIEKADVIIYDQLIPKEILRYAQKECELIFVGKSPGKHYRLQDEINQLLIEKATEGRGSNAASSGESSSESSSESNGESNGESSSESNGESSSESNGSGNAASSGKSSSESGSESSGESGSESSGESNGSSNAASSGKSNVIVRLKGGDPFVLGRGGEEALALAENGIDFEVVPGVSSATAVPAYAGIPVTHRGLASAFTVITGHEDPAKLESQIAWEHISKTGGTLIFLMAMANLQFITEKLAQGGLDKATPVAVIQNGAGPGQKTVSGNLGTIAALVQQHGLSNPAVIVVGQVVGLREALDWFERKPLFGQHIVVTRARQQSSKLTEALEDLGAQVLELPVIAFDAPSDPTQLGQVMQKIDTFSWMIFTSVNGVEAFFKELFSSNTDIRRLAHAQFVAIGPATQKALEQKGLRGIFLPAVYDAANLARYLDGKIAAGEKVLVVRPEQARDILSVILRERGALVTEVAAYKTVSANVNTEALIASLAAGEVDAITFTSSSTVRNLLQLIAGDTGLLKGVKLCSIGTVTSDTLREHGLAPSVEATDSCIEGLVDAIVSSV